MTARTAPSDAPATTKASAHDTGPAGSEGSLAGPASPGGQRKGKTLPPGRPHDLHALADEWDAAAPDIEAAGKAVDPTQALISRGRARQLADCARELREALAKEAPCNPE